MTLFLWPMKLSYSGFNSMFEREDLCLLVSRIHKNYRMDLHEILQTGGASIQLRANCILEQIQIPVHANRGILQKTFLNKARKSVSHGRSTVCELVVIKITKNDLPNFSSGKINGSINHHLYVVIFVVCSNKWTNVWDCSPPVCFIVSKMT